MRKKCQNPECDKEISASRLKHNSNQKYCSHTCATLMVTKDRKASGFYNHLSQIGNTAQAQYKQDHGTIPGYGSRGYVKAAKEGRHLGGRQKGRSNHAE